MNTDKHDELDELLAGLKQAKQQDGGLQNSALAERIMRSLPGQDNVTVLSQRRQRLMMTAFGGALAASLVALAIFLPANNTGTLTADPVFEQWAWEEVLDETPASASDDADLGMLALLELDNTDDVF